ncbi:MAG: heavy-metal-associated domain-containing protein [Sulfurimonas sp.]|nr:heavy-metal-associated domain-containing protein [Sulfurimonas sp.]
MNKVFLVKMIVSLGIILSVTNCSENTNTELTSKTKEEKKLKKLLNVQGMTCESCENAIEAKLLQLPGVTRVQASHEDKTVIVDFDENKISTAVIEKTIIETGYRIITPLQSAHENEALKEAPKSAMKCGEGKCGDAK